MSNIKRELRLVMNEETTRCVAEVLSDWVQECNELGFSEGTESVTRVVSQLNKEKSRLFDPSTEL